MANDLIINTSVVGSDDKTPIYNPEGKHAIYALHELWDGTVGEKRFVPNINDLVIDVMRTTANKFWIVTALSVDLVPTLKPWGSEPMLSLDLDDVLTAPGNSTHNGTMRAYLDTTVTPHTLTVENRMSYKGSVASYVKIFRGALTEDLLGAGQTRVISGYYDAMGNLQSDSIPLELVGVDNNNPQRTEYCIPTCYTKEEIPNNEILTVVAYSQEGHMVSKTQVLLENSSFARSRNTSIKYITHIELVSPFLSKTDEHLLQLPINVTLQGLYLKGRVHYSDGTHVDYPVDNTKFSILGMDTYLATMVNQKIPVVLRYKPSAGELLFGGTRGSQLYITQPYTVKTIKANGAYYVRLYGYPEWQNALNGYRIRWWLYTGERNTFYDVTSKVQYSVNSPAFNPTLYGAMQNLNVSVNLADVNPIFESYRHAQTVGVILWRQGTERQTNWSVLSDPNQDPAYGVDTFARLQFINYNYYKINLHSGCKTQDEWLTKLYYNTKPFIDPLREVDPPKPSHFVLMVGSNAAIELSIADWNKTQSILNGLNVNDTVYLRWLLKTPETNLELGVSGLPCWDNNNIDLPAVMVGT